jgi:peptide chain release factor 2
LRSSLECPDLWSNSKKISEVQKQIKALEAVVEPSDHLSEHIPFLMEMDELGEDVAGEMASAEAALSRLEAMSLGPDDLKSCYLTIQAGAGGREACNWAEMLLRMYAKMVDKLGFEASLMDVAYHEPDGINYATIKVTGAAYGRFKHEAGVHRLSRVSPFDQADRRQTSFAAVEVTPEAPPEVEFQIDPKEIEVDYCCGGGPGGQKINKTEVVAQVKHLPTGITVRCQETRVQQRNKEIALLILKSKLVQRRDAEREAEAAKQKELAPKAAFGGQQLRSYVLSQHPAVHDHRTGKSTTRTDDVLNGDLDDLV